MSAIDERLKQRERARKRAESRGPEKSEVQRRLEERERKRRRSNRTYQTEEKKPVEYGAAERGYRMSTTGFLLNPPTSYEEYEEMERQSAEAGFLSSLGQAVSGFVSDAPAMGLGALVGGALGGGIGTAAGGPAGTVVGAGIGSTVGAFALPEMLKSAYIEYLKISSEPEFQGLSFGDVLSIASREGIGFAKGATLGAIMALAPQLSVLKKVPGVQKILNTKAGKAVASTKVGQAIGRGPQTALGKFATEVGALTVGGAALEGELPTLKGAGMNAILVGGIKAILHLPSMRSRYKQMKDAGVEKPEEAIAAKMAKDGVVPPEDMMSSEFDKLTREYAGAVLKDIEASKRSLSEERAAKEAKMMAEEEVKISKAEQAISQKESAAEAKSEAVRREEAAKKRSAEQAERRKLNLIDESEARQLEDLQAKRKLRDDQAKRLADKKNADIDALQQAYESGLMSKSEYSKAKAEVKSEYDQAIKDSNKSFEKTTAATIDSVAKAVAAGPVKQKVSKVYKPIIDEAVSQHQSRMEKAANKAIKQLSSIDKAFEATQKNIPTTQGDLSTRLRQLDKLEKQRQSVANDLQKALKDSEALYEKEVNALLKDIDIRRQNVKKIKESSSGKLSKESKQKLTKLTEKLDKDTEALKTSLEDLKAQSQDRIDRFNETFDKKEQKLDADNADKLAKAARKIKDAQDRGYIEFPANLIDPNAKAGEMKRAVFVDRLPEDAGKSSLDVVKSRLAPRGTGKESLFTRVKNNLSNARQKLFDAWAPLRDVTKKASQDPAKLAEQVKFADSKAAYILEEAVFDLETMQDTHKGLLKIVEEHFGNEPVDSNTLGAYLAAGSSLERQNAGQKSAVPTSDALNIINDGSKYAKLARGISDFLDAYLNSRKVKSGIWSEAGAEAAQRKYEFYAPLFRVVDAMNNYGNGGSSLLPKMIDKGAKGSWKFIINPMESIIEGIFASERNIAKNELSKSIAFEMKKRGYVPELFEYKPLTREQVASMMDVKPSEITDGYLNQVNNVRKANSIGTAMEGNEIHWFDDGKMYKMMVPPEVFDLMQNTTRQELGTAFRWAEKVRSFHSQAVTSTPDTMLRLTGMDILTGTIQSKHGALSFLSGLPRAFYEVFSGSRGYKEFAKAGKLDFSLDAKKADVDVANQSFANAIKAGDQEAISWAKSMIKAPWELAKYGFRQLNLFSSMLGDAVRYNEFSKTMEKAANKAKQAGIELDLKEAFAQAANDAYEVSVPYGREGSAKTMRILNRFLPFARTVMTSTESFAKTVNPMTARGRMGLARAFTALTVPTVYLYMKNRNDPRYQRLTQEEKDNYIYVYKNSPEDDPNEEPIRLRKFWQYGVFFQTIPEKIVESMLSEKGQEINSWNSLARVFEFEFSPITPANFVDSIKHGRTDPSKIFGGRYNIVPRSLEQLDPEFRDKPMNSETGKFLSKWIGLLDEAYWDHAFNMIGAKWGKKALEYMDEILIGVGIARDTKQGRDLADSLLFGTFFGRGVGKRSSYRESFYEIYNEQKSRYRTYNDLIQAGRTADAERLLREKPFVDQTMLNKMAKNLTSVMKLIKAEEERENVKAGDRERKRDRIRELESQLHALAKEYDETLKQMVK